MIIEKINGYALALFTLGIEEKKLKTLKNDAKVALAAISAHEEITTLLSSGVLTTQTKEQLVDDAFKKLSHNLQVFFKIVFNQNKGKYVLPVLKKLIKLINEKEAIREGIIYTTIKLTKAEITHFEQKAKAQWGFKPALINQLDPDLIAGFKIVVGDDVIEDSVVSRLDQLKNKLLKREGH